MKTNGFVCRDIGLCCLVLAVLISSAAAGKPGSCTIQNCTTTMWCGSPGTGGKACWIKVSEANDPSGVPTANVDGPDPVCVHSNTDIFWYTLEAGSDFKVTFGTTHPFANTPAGVFQGKKVQPAGDTATVPSGSVCYEYSVEHCIKGKCAKADPKVIVTNVRGRRSAGHRNIQ
jgi:hypothetical protein